MKIIRDNDFVENLKHAEGIITCHVNCIIQKEDKIKLAELGKDIKETPGNEINIENLELYNREHKNLTNYNDRRSAIYEEKIKKNIPTVLSDSKRFNTYLDRCINNTDYLKTQLCSMEKDMYKNEKYT